MFNGEANECGETKSERHIPGRVSDKSQRRRRTVFKELDSIKAIRPTRGATANIRSYGAGSARLS